MMGWGVWCRTQVGTDDASFLPAAAQACCCPLELIAVPLCPAFGGNYGDLLVA